MTVSSRISSPAARVRAAVVVLAAMAAIFVSLGALPSEARAGSDRWSCSSTLHRPCPSPYQHHEEYVVADYFGAGNLPLLAGSYCQEAGCGGANNYIWYLLSGDFNPPAYNHLIACYRPISCGTNSPWLGRGHAENRHTSTHTVHGQDSF